MKYNENLSLDSLPNEEWRDCVGWEGLYKISSQGRILCCERLTNHNHKLNAIIFTLAVTENKKQLMDFYGDMRKIQILITKLEQLLNQ